jgi:tRNA(Arg) A34 adenosine deaminase TadA
MTHELAISAGKKGNHTFGALLVHQGKVILTAENTVRTDRDSTRHAELNLVVSAERELPEEVIRASTLYTSTAPCLMCTAAIWFAGINRVVYSVSYEAFARLIAEGYQYIPCDEVFQRLGTPLELAGPVLEEEGLQVYQYWQPD